MRFLSTYKSRKHKENTNTSVFFFVFKIATCKVKIKKIAYKPLANLFKRKTKVSSF